MNRFLIFLFCSIDSFSFAQIDSLILTKQNNWYFSFAYENDLFSRTDRYYTQGVHAQLVGPIFEKSPLSKILLGKSKWLNYYGVNIEQDCFTPTSILFDTINKFDRPYAGTVLFSSFRASIHAGTRFNSKLDMGIIGPCAKCEEEQKAIHEATDNDEPLGWGQQISQDIILNYEASVEHGTMYTYWLEVYGGSAIRLGSLHTDLSFDINLRIGLMDSYFKNFGIEKKSSGKKFQLYLTAKAKERYVVYNATLQGGLFTDSPYEVKSSDVTRFVFSSDIGLTMAYKRVQLEFARTYIAREFKTGLDHGWGRCKLMLCF